MPRSRRIEIVAGSGRPGRRFAARAARTAPLRPGPRTPRSSAGPRERRPSRRSQSPEAWPRSRGPRGRSRRGPSGREAARAAESRRRRSTPLPASRPSGPRGRRRAGLFRSGAACETRGRRGGRRTPPRAQSRCRPCRLEVIVPEDLGVRGLSRASAISAFRTIFEAFSKGTRALKRAKSASRNPEPGSALERSRASRMSSTGIIPGS